MDLSNKLIKKFNITAHFTSILNQIISKAFNPVVLKWQKQFLFSKKKTSYFHAIIEVLF